MAEREPLGSPLGFRANDFEVSLRDIDPPMPKRTSASPFVREEPEADRAPAPVRKLDPGNPDVAVAKRPVSIPPPAEAAVLQQRAVTPRRFGRLSASAVAATRPEEDRADSMPQLGGRFESRVVHTPEEGAMISPRGRSAPVTRFGRLQAPSAPELALDDPEHYSHYEAYTQLSQAAISRQTRELQQLQEEEQHRRQRVRGHSAPVLKPDILQAAAKPADARAATVPHRAGEDGAGAQVGEGEGEGAGEGAHYARSSEMSSSGRKSGDSKKSSGSSGFLASLFGFMGRRDANNKTPTDDATAPAAGATRGRSAPVSRPPGAHNAAPQEASNDQHTHLHKGRPVPKSAPLSRDGGSGAPALAAPQPTSQTATSHTSRSLGGGFTPQPPAAPNQKHAPRPVPGSRGDSTGSRPVSSLSPTIEEGAGDVEGGGLGEAGSEAGAAVEAAGALVPRGEIEAPLGDMGWELFELARMGELEGLQSVVLSLSVVGKGQDVVAMRDGSGMQNKP
jgi:hypothetical protein